MFRNFPLNLIQIKDAIECLYQWKCCFYHLDLKQEFCDSIESTHCCQRVIIYEPWSIDHIHMIKSLSCHWDLWIHLHMHLCESIGHL
jgi:hypothetical protein